MIGQNFGLLNFWLVVYKATHVEEQTDGKFLKLKLAEYTCSKLKDLETSPLHLVLGASRVSFLLTASPRSLVLLGFFN